MATISEFQVFPAEHTHTQTEGLLVVPEVVKVDWEAEPPVIRLLSVELAPSLGSGVKHPLHL